MKFSARARLTIIFISIFLALLILSSTLIYLRVSHSLHKDFHAEMVHDGRIMAELFKEELKLNALSEFSHEIEEFGFDLQVVDEKGQPLVQSRNWDRLTSSLASEILEPVREQPVFKELRVEKKPYSLFSRPIFIPSAGQQYTLHMIRSQEGVRNVSARLLEWMLIIKPFMVLVAGLIGYLFSGRVLRAEEEAFERLKRFTADASHELRIPLTALRGNLDVALRRERTAAEYREAIEEALDEAEHLSQLTQDLLLLAQTDENQIQLKKENIQVKDFLTDVFSQSQAIKNDLNIRLELRPLPEGRALIDAERIRELILNLISNAVTYNKPGGSVTLGAEMTDENLVVTVEDTGIGIARGEQEKIFNRFYRVDKSRSRQVGGTGLGLSIARWIVQAHNGRLTVQSQEGRGSVFTVTLPR